MSYQYRDPILKIRRSRDRLIFTMGIPYLGKTVFILRQGPELYSLLLVYNPLFTFCGCFVIDKSTHRLLGMWLINVISEHMLRINSLRPRLNRRPFADDIFKCIFFNENEWNLPRISLKFDPKVRINNIPALVQIMAWRRLGAKPLSEPIMVILLTHICVTRPQWVKFMNTSFKIAHRWIATVHISRQVNICSGYALVPSSNKPLPEPMLTQNYVATWRF